MSDSTGAEADPFTLSGLLAGLPDPVVVLGADGRIRWLNEAARGMPLRIGAAVSELDFPAELTQLWAEFVARGLGGETGRLEYEVPTSGGPRWYESTYVSVLAPDGPAVGVISRDVTDRKRAERDLAEQAMLDPLTGLANRRLALSELDRLVARLERRGEAFAAVLVDLDDFKVTNDTRGHATGDAVLVRVAERLADQARAGDLVARLGGDEFLVLLGDLRHDTDAVTAARRLVEAVGAPLHVDGRPVTVAASAGVVVIDRPGLAPSTALDWADGALYAAKEAGPGSVECFDDELRHRVASRTRLELGLEEAVADGSLRIWFQPEVDLAGGEVVAVEALLRWWRASAWVEASRFLPAVADTPLAGRILDWAVAEALRAGAGIVAVAPHVRVRINLAPAQLHAPDLADRFRVALEAAGMNAGQVCVELAEDAVLERDPDVSATIDALHALGVGFAVDDFGAARGAVRALDRVPVEVIKLDRDLVRGTGRRDRSRRMVGAVTALASALGIPVVAEGVETPVQAETLRRLGVSAGQGWLFGEAVPAERLIRRLRA